MKSWKQFMRFPLKPDLPISDQISDRVISGITTGFFPPGKQLLSLRELAALILVDKKTVERAYKKLLATRWICARGRAGYYVAPEPPALHYSNLRSMASEPAEPGYFTRQENFNKATPNASAAGPVQFPFEYLTVVKVDDLVDKILQSYKHYSSFQYRNRINGCFNSLSNTISLLLKQEGFRYSPDEFCLLTGENSSLDIICSVLISKGDLVVMYMPGSRDYYQRFCYHKAEVVPVYGDYESFVQQLEAIVKKQKIKMVLVESACQFPTTRALSDLQKQELLHLAESFDFLLLEVNNDHEFWYSDVPFEPIYRSGNSHVLYLSCVSRFTQHLYSLKYLLGPAKIIEQVKIARKFKGDKDEILSCAQEEIILKGIMHLLSEKTQKQCFRHRDLMDLLIARYLSPFVDYTPPDAGLAYWLQLKKPGLMPLLINKLAAIRIRIPDPDGYSCINSNPGGFRLGFAGLKEKTASEALEKIASCLQALDSG